MTFKDVAVETYYRQCKAELDATLEAMLTGEDWEHHATPEVYKVLEYVGIENKK